MIHPVESFKKIKFHSVIFTFIENTILFYGKALITEI